MQYTWDLNPVALSLFGLEVRWYGLAYVAGFLLAVHLGYWIWQQHQENKPAIKKPAFESFVFSTFLAAVLGGRLGLFLFYSPNTFWQDPLQILRIWEGGMSIHGGVIGATLWGAWQAHKKGWPIWRLSDTFMPPVAIGLFFGRLANFVNGELYGRPTDLDWGVIFPHVDNLLRHPSQLYEAGYSLLLAIILWILIKRDGLQSPGLLTVVMLIGYGFMRFWTEFLREPSGYVWIFTTGQALCLVMIGLGSVVLVTQKPWRK